MSWHSKTLEETTLKLESNLSTGLSLTQVQESKEKYGANVITEFPDKTLFQMIFAQLTDFMILILIGAAIISAIMNQVHDALIILLIIILNAIIGVIQEYRAEKSLQELKKMVPSFVMVVRNSLKKKLPTADLVPGDLVLLEAGEKVPADIRLTQCHSLKINEATLTGESVPVDKTHKCLSDPELTLADQTNMAFSATNITYGRGQGLVIAIGSNTELGKIAHLIMKEERVKTPLQIRLMQFGKKLTLYLILVCLFIFFMGLFRGEDPFIMFLTAVSLAVAAIPEALPSVVTVSLSLGARILAKKNALIQNLPAVEALGSITYICSDKTGTITKNEMYAEKYFFENPKDNSDFWRAVCLNNDSQFKDSQFLGDPTEVAIMRGAIENQNNPSELQKLYPRVFEIPFDSERKLMSTFHNHAELKYFLVTKGAPEVILPRCGREDLLVKAEELAKEGLRVLAFAQKPLLENEIPDTELNSHDIINYESNLEFLGLIGLIDPPRDEIQQAVSEAREAGITPIMITGDHPLTAKVIAKRVGIITDDKQLVFTGTELNQTNDEELSKQIKEIRVFSRCTPQQKIRIVKTLQNLGEYVAMTGDGVNDAPALKRADIGVAMGITGTDVAKESASIILLDDNFITIVMAIREGRRILVNIKKFIKFALTGNAGEIITILMAPLFGLPTPLLPIHILWVNLVTDGLPGLALANEVEEGNIMKLPPRDPKEGLLTKSSTIHVLLYGMLVGTSTLFAAYLGLKENTQTMHTMAFTVLNISQLFLIMELRFTTISIFNFKKMSSNLPMHLAFYISLGIVLFALYSEWGHQFFKLISLTSNQLLTCVIISSSTILVKEIEKIIIRYKNKLR